jgi:hypothetical protein
MDKFIVGLARILPLCALLLALPALAASPGSVTLSPNQGTVGTGVTASGTGWPANASVNAFFNLDPKPINTLPETVDSNGNFTLNFCVPNLAPGVYPTFFTISQFSGMYSGPIFTITAGTAGNCQSTAKCPDVYFIGVHGFGEGPDQAGNGDCAVVRETWEAFEKLVKQKGKEVKYHSIWYPAPTDLTNIAGMFQDLDIGVQSLDKHIREVLKTCPAQNIVLVGYSFGAWVINEWLTKGLDEQNGNWTFWPQIRAVELYGDPLWSRAGQDYKNTPFIYPGLATVIPNTHSPYVNNPPGPAGKVITLANRWQSRCLKGDPICGEGYPMVFDPMSHLVQNPQQLPDAVGCANPNTVCEHEKYTKANGGYSLTERGANYLSLKAFPPVIDHPQIIYHETFREGALVFFREFFTNPAPALEAKGFGFVGVNGSGWAEENHPFENPSYGRVHLDQPSVEYPFNHACGTSNAYESDVDAWINYVSQGAQSKSNRELNHLACTAPCEVVTPYSTFTWDDVSSSRLSCSSTAIAR